VTLIGDKGFAGRGSGDLVTAGSGLRLVRPGRRGEAPRHRSAGWIWQWTGSGCGTLKGQLDPERHGGPTTQGPHTTIAQRLLAMAACTWHDRAAGEPAKRPLIASGH
jgi:hypothetical protein